MAAPPAIQTLVCLARIIIEIKSKGGVKIVNRIAILGSLVAAAGFFFFPLLELKPNVVASGVTFNLLELQGDYRYPILFSLTLVPPLLAFRQDRYTRGWTLALFGNLLMILTLWLPTLAGEQLLENVDLYLQEGMQATNPRILPSIGVALGIFGGYIVLFSGILDLKATTDSRGALLFAGWIGAFIIIFMLVSGTLDTYSVMEEYNERGTVLNERFIEHITFVSVSLLVGTIVGISLGLWASRDERVGPIILYAVGIIQTIPSLALFGILLVPLARLGDREFSGVFVFFLAAAAIAAVLIALYVFLQSRLSSIQNTVLLIISALALMVPLALFVVVFVSFIFRVTLLALTTSDYSGANSFVLLFVLAGVALWLAKRFDLLRKREAKRIATYASYLAYIIALIIVGVTFYQSSGDYLRNVDSFEELTIRDLGVSGIGVAPALIALTLYSLLPLVRNTYAGLNNVDPAVIDSGRGMGMTPRQIFFRIELPLAFPVIMAGIRNAGVALVGIGTVATIIGAGGLGDFVYSGIVNTSLDRILLGAIPAIFLAFGLDTGLRTIENLLTSPGIQQAAKEM